MRRLLLLATVVLAALALPSVASGTLTFRSGGSLLTADGSRDVAAADFNGDGRPDVVRAPSTAGPPEIAVNQTPRGATTAQFGPLQELPSPPGTNVLALVTGDINADGRPDVVAVGEGSEHRVDWWLNETPDGAATVTFSARQSTSLSDTPVDLVLISDALTGALDVVTANQGGGAGSSTLLEGDGAGGFTDVGDEPLSVTPTSIVSGAFSASVVSLGLGASFAFGDLDSPTIELDVCGCGSNAILTVPDSTGRIVGLAAGDLDGRNGDDIVATTSDGITQIFTNSGVALAPTAAFASAGGLVGPPTLGHLVGRGLPDLVTPNITFSVLEAYVNTGTGTLLQTARAFGSGGVWTSAIADVNGDGANDLVSAPNADGPLTFNFSAPAIDVAGLDLGNVPTGGQSAALPVTFTNTGSAPAALGAGALTFSGTDAADFALVADTCSSTTLAPGGRCTALVRFTPSATGARSATLTLATATGDTIPAALSGTGITVPAGGDGPQGPVGTDGAQGGDGVAGSTGAAGLPGPDGGNGPAGEKGTSGSSGPQGYPGRSVTRRIPSRCTKKGSRISCAVTYNARPGCRAQGTLLRGRAVVATGAWVTCGSTPLSLRWTSRHRASSSTRYTLAVAVRDRGKGSIARAVTVKVRT